MGYVLLILSDHSLSVLRVKMLKDESLPTWVEGRGEKVPFQPYFLQTVYSKYLQCVNRLRILVTSMTYKSREDSCKER